MLENLKARIRSGANLVLFDRRGTASAANPVTQGQPGQKAFTGVGGGYGGGWSYGYNGNLGNGSAFDAPAGDLHDNSAVQICLNKITSVFPEAPLTVKYTKQGDDGKESDVIDYGHALPALIRKPNPYYDGNALWSATIVSSIAGRDGSAYWLKVRDDADTVRELWYAPDGWIYPVSEPGSADFISFYWYTAPGQKPQRIERRDVIHFRNGLNPHNQRLSLGPLHSLLREVLSDDEMNAYTLFILRNRGIPGAVISPKSGVILSPDHAIQIKREYLSNTTGDNRGMPFVLPVEVDVSNASFSPEQLCLDKIRQIPEARICAAIGIPAMVAGLSVGDAQRTYSNYGEAREAFWEECIVPMMTRFAATLDAQILTDKIGTVPGQPGQSSPMARVRPQAQVRQWSHFDLNSVRALQEDKAKLYTRMAQAVGGPFLTVNEGRSELGLPPIEGGDELYKKNPAPTAPGNPAGGADENGDEAQIDDLTGDDNADEGKGK